MTDFKLPEGVKRYYPLAIGPTTTMQSSEEGAYVLLSDVYALLTAERSITADAITGALAFGSQNTNPPPAGHWLDPFWKIGRYEAEARIAAEQRLADLEKAKGQELADLLDVVLVRRNEWRHLAAEGEKREALQDRLDALEKAGPEEIVRTLKALREADFSSALRRSDSKGREAEECARRLLSAIGAMQERLDRWRDVLHDASARMKSARHLLTDGYPRPECNWGMLDSSRIDAALGETK